MVREAAATGDVSGRFATIGTVLEDTLSKGRVRRIPMNVDGATAVIHCELGLAPELGRGVFILSRSVGILAHAWEQMQQGGRIKGPQAKFLNYTYDGPPRRDLTVTRTNEPTEVVTPSSRCWRLSPGANESSSSTSATNRSRPTPPTATPG